MYCQRVAARIRSLVPASPSRPLATASTTLGDGADLWSAVRQTGDPDARDDPEPKVNWVEVKEERAEKWRQMKAEKRKRESPKARTTGQVWYKHASESITAPFTHLVVSEKLMQISSLAEAIRDDRGDSAPPEDVPMELYDPKRRMWLEARYHPWDTIRMPLHLIIHDDHQIRARNAIEEILRKTCYALSADSIWDTISASGKELGAVSNVDDVRICLARMVKDKTVNKTFVRNLETERKTKEPGWQLNSSRRLKWLVDAQEAYLDTRRYQVECEAAENTKECARAKEKADAQLEELKTLEIEFDEGMKFYKRTHSLVVQRVAKMIADGELNECIQWDRRRRWKGFMWTEWWKEQGPYDRMDVDNILEYTGEDASAFFHEFLDLDSPIRKTTLYKRRLHPEIDDDKRQGVWRKKVPVKKNKKYLNA